jgi:hypothetical protein
MHLTYLRFRKMDDYINLPSITKNIVIQTDLVSLDIKERFDKYFAFS